MYENVLVPTDGSEGSDRAIELAIDLAKTYDAALHTLYVIDANTLSSGDEFGSVISSLEESAQNAIDEVVEMAEEGGVRTTEAYFARGIPHKAILDYADDHDIEIIVMGTHGRTGLDRYLLGSVTEKVVRTADVPVLTARMSDSDE
ncbi:universal stress protein [Haladaptatus sp. NG-SE-30]